MSIDRVPGSNSPASSYAIPAVGSPERGQRAVDFVKSLGEPPVPSSNGSIPAPVTGGAPQAKAAAGAALLTQKIDPRITAAVNTLGFKLQQAAGDTAQNSIVSGASVAIFLAMMTNGADAVQSAKVLTSLGLGNMSLAKANGGFKALAAQLTAKADGVECSIANSVWADKNKFGAFDDDFVAKVAEEFGTEAVTTELAGAADDINGWASKHTNGVIKEICDDALLAECYFVAMNALYFKGTWATQFDAKRTFAGAPFTKEDGTETKVDMMSASDVKGEKNRGEDFTAVKLPYGKDGAASMLVVQPKEGGKLADVIAKLSTEEGQAEILGGMREQKGDVYLPKFEVETETDLTKACKTLGIDIAGPYSAVGARSVSFDLVKQNAKITVNEQGAEAAAVTSGFALESIRLPMLEANSPFAFAIVDNRTNTITFSGVFAG